MTSTATTNTTSTGATTSVRLFAAAARARDLVRRLRGGRRWDQAGPAAAADQLSWSLAARGREAARAEAMQLLGACPKAVSAAAATSTGRYGAWSWWEDRGGQAHVCANGRHRATIVYGGDTTLPYRGEAEARYQRARAKRREWEARRAAHRSEAIAALERGATLRWRDGQMGGTLETPSGHLVSARGVAAHFGVAPPTVDWSLVDWDTAAMAQEKAAQAFAGRVVWRDVWVDSDPHAAARERAAERARRNDAGRRPAAKPVYVKEARRKATLREVLAFV